MKRLFMALGLLAMTGVGAQAETISELSEGGLVVLSSHYDQSRSVIVLVMGDLQGAPLFVCETRYRVGEGDSFDQCRKLR